MSASPAYLRWALEKKKKARSTVSATRDFESLLNLNNIRSHRRKKLANAFKYFQAHHQERFWAERALEVNTEVAVKRAGTIMQDAGVNEAKMACERFFSNNEGRSLEMDLVDDSEGESGSESESSEGRSREADLVDDSKGESWSESESKREEEGTAISSKVYAGVETPEPATKAPVGEDDAELLEDLEQQLTRAKATPFYDLIKYVFNK
ncbi:hypothetical protein BGZ80_006924, partial [Entomortierella chlamydospora]